MKSVLTAAIALLLTVSIASASVVLSASATAPTDNVAISQTVATGSNDAKMPDSGLYEAAQTFTPAQSFTLDKVTVLARAGEDNLPTTVTLGFKLFQANADGSYSASNVILSDTAIAMPSDGTGTGRYFTFDLPDQLLNAGTTYGFSMWVTSGSSAGNHNLVVANSNPYADGTSVRLNHSGTINANQTADDLVFYAQSVPEPATMSLLAIGAVAGLIRRRK